MSRVAIRHVLALLIMCWCMPALAQPNVEVYWDDNNRADTVMDFGVTLEGYPVSVPFYVRNNGDVPVCILQTNPNAEPYYQIVNTPDVLPSDPRKEEFEGVEILPYIIAPHSTDTLHVLYKAVKNNPVFPPDVIAKAFLELRVVSQTDTLGPAVFKRFLMLALKTRNTVATNKPVIRFDSVYVLPSPQPPSESYAIGNASSIPIPVEQQKLVYRTSVVGSPEFVVDTLQTAVFAPHKSLTWDLKYRPHNVGKDSADFIVVYRPNQGSNADSVTTSLSGVGVKQELTVDAANGVPPPVTVRPGMLADTIDFADVNADGSGGKLAKIILKNTGNIHIRYLSETEIGTPSDTAAFIIEKSLMEGGLDTRTNEFDTLHVRFKPINGGLHIERYVIQTDLLTRSVRGIPDGADQKVLVFRGFARKPQVSVTPQQIDFGSVVMHESCPSAVVRSVFVKNTGNIIARIDSAHVEPPGAAITMSPHDPIPPIDVDGTIELKVSYQPTQLETLNATLVLYTNAFGPPVRISMSGSSVRSDSIRVQLPVVKAQPGTVINIPVLVDARSIALAQTSSLTLSFDPSLLRFRGIVTGGTASEGSTVLQLMESPRGYLQIQLRSGGSFAARDTFAMLTFDTYLGNAAATELSIKRQTTLIGNDGCANIFTVHAVSGQFVVDSVCGLPFKTATSGVLRMNAWPNPTSNTVHVQVETLDSSTVQVAVVDTYGAVLETVAVKGAGDIDLGKYPSGIYIIVATKEDHLARHVVVKQ